jgi:hypothetical protein
MMKTTNRRFLLVTSVLACVATAARAENFPFTDGDLVIGVQAVGGTGSAQNVFFNVGSGTALRDNGNQGALGNIGATLATVFGANWYERPDVYFGVIGNLNQNPTSGIGSRTPVNGDPSRTIYVSIAAASPGSGFLIPAGTFSSSALGTAANDISSLEDVFRNDDDNSGVIGGFKAESDGSAILDSTNPNATVAWNNSWSNFNPTPGASFRTFSNIQQNFGKGGSATYVDVQRVLATNTGANPTGVVGGGTYVTTIGISSNGTVTATKSGSGGSAFADWIAQFAAQIPLEADRAPGADPDKDGFTNLQEFAFGGNPAVAGDNGQRYTRTVDATGNSLRDLTLTVEVRAGATFTVSGSAMVAVRDGVSYRIEGTTDLQNFNSPVSEVTPHLGTGSPKTGYEFKTFRLNASSGLTGQGFLRTTVEEG